jgi:hypothetical protein
MTRRVWFHRARAAAEAADDSEVLKRLDRIERRLRQPGDDA